MEKMTFDEMISHFNIAVSEMQITQKQKMELLGMITAIAMKHNESVKHGHWIRGKSYPHHIYCSRCYRTYVPNDEIEMWKDDTRLPRKYCPECGALMDEVTES